MMRTRIFFIAAFVLVVAISLASQMRTQPVEIKTYELYSWQDDKEVWMFSLFPAISDAGIHPDVIMRPSNGLAGQERLKRAIAALPAGSDIIWLDHAVGMWKEAKGWERIKFPRDEVITDVRKFCETKGFKLSIDRQKK